MALNVGDRLGHYDVTALIGEGGDGTGLSGHRHPAPPRGRPEGRFARCSNWTDHMKSASAITGVAEIVLNVRDLPRMRQFYEEVLGFALLSQACHANGVRPDADGEPTIAFLTIQGTGHAARAPRPSTALGVDRLPTARVRRGAVRRPRTVQVDPQPSGVRDSAGQLRSRTQSVGSARAQASLDAVSGYERARPLLSRSRGQ